MIDIYNSLLALQVSGQTFTLYTGKRVYPNMLIKSLATESDAKSENTLPITAVCQEVIIVSTQSVKIGINNSALANPEANTSSNNAGTKQLSPAPNYTEITTA